MMSAPRIAVIGAGPGGLTLARLLQQGGLFCTVYEQDQSNSTRGQAGIVDLDSQLALREAGLFEELQNLVIPAAQAQKAIKNDGMVCWDDNAKKHSASRDRPEIDRTALREMLFNSMEPGSVNWGRKLVRNEAAGKKYDLHFADGIQADFDLVVGADGAWSKVRPLLTDERPCYSSVTMVELRAENVSKNRQWLANFTSTGSLFIFDEDRALVCQHQANDSIRVYVAVRQPESWIEDCGIDWGVHESARKALAEKYFGDCHDYIKRAIATEATDGLEVWPLYMLPIGHTRVSRSNMTLLGDAAHLMTPFAGLGVNLAMADALDLARTLLRRKDSFETDLAGILAEAIEEYEGPMFERANQNMEKAWTGLHHHFSADGIDHRGKKSRARAKQVGEARKRGEEERENQEIC